MVARGTSSAAAGVIPEPGSRRTCGLRDPFPVPRLGTPKDVASGSRVVPARTSRRMLQQHPWNRFWVSKGHPGSTRVALQDQGLKGFSIPGAKTRVPTDAPSPLSQPGSPKMPHFRCQEQDPKGFYNPVAKSRIPKESPSHAARLEMLLQSAPALSRIPRGSFVGCITQAEAVISAFKSPKSWDIQCQSHAGSTLGWSVVGTGPCACSQPRPWDPTRIQNRP